MWLALPITMHEGPGSLPGGKMAASVGFVNIYDF